MLRDWSTFGNVPTCSEKQTNKKYRTKLGDSEQLENG